MISKQALCCSQSPALRLWAAAVKKHKLREGVNKKAGLTQWSVDTNDGDTLHTSVLAASASNSCWVIGLQPSSFAFRFRGRCSWRSWTNEQCMDNQDNEQTRRKEVHRSDRSLSGNLNGSSWVMKRLLHEKDILKNKGMCEGITINEWIWE